MKMDVGGAQLYYEVHENGADDQCSWLIFSHSLVCNTGMWAL